MSRFEVLSQLPLVTIRRLAAEKLYLMSFADYVRGAWPVHHEHEPLEWGWYLDVVCTALQLLAEGRLVDPTLIINLPPGLAKSYVCSVCFPAWIHAREPWRRFVCSTASEKNLYRDSRRTQEQIQSPWYAQNFRRGKWGLKSGATSYGSWQTTEHGERVSVTPKQALTGAKSHFGMLDDILDVRDAYTGSAEINRLPGWQDQTFTTRLVHATSPRVLIMQRLHEADPSAHWLRQESCAHICLPAEFDGVERKIVYLDERGKKQEWFYDQRKKEGELLAPLRYDAAALAQWKLRLGPAAYSAQFQQRPTPAEGLTFEADWLQYWIDPPTDLDVIFTSWDPGWREGRRNDYTCGQIWGIKGHAAFLLAQDRGIWNPPKMIERVRVMAQRVPNAVAHVIEAKAAGPRIISEIQGVVDRVLPADPQKAGLKKQARIASTTPIWAAKRVWIPHPYDAPKSTPWHTGGYQWVADDFVPEYLAFPLGVKDDQIDCAAQALGMAFAEEINWDMGSVPY